MTDASTSLVRTRHHFDTILGVLPIVAVLSLAGCAQLDSPVAPPKAIALAPASTEQPSASERPGSSSIAC